MKYYQDLLDAKNIEKFIVDAVLCHTASEQYQTAVCAEQYDRQQNVTISNYQKILYTISGKAIPDVFTANHKIASNFFNRIITEENQYLLGNGITLSDIRNKEKLGRRFDNKLQELGRISLVQGVGFGFWNLDHLEVFKLTEFCPLYDITTGHLMAGIRFWNIEDRPWNYVLYETDGYSSYVQQKNGELKISAPKVTYKRIVKESMVDGRQEEDAGNYNGFPIIEMYGSPLRQSELVGMRESIDCYDLIKSGFANDIDDASMIYWTLSNSGGMDDVDLASFVERMKSVKVAAVDDDTQVQSHTVDVPYQGRKAYLDKLEHDIYADAQVLNVVELAGSQRTATEIRAAYLPMDLKADQYEWCVRDFIEKLFMIIGIDDEPSFTRNRIANELEVTQTVLMAAEHIDTETLLNKLPWLTPEEVQQVIERKAEEDARRLGMYDESEDKTVQ